MTDLGPIAIELRGVSKVYAQDGLSVTALDSVDLTVREGEYLALTGASGSGKSTLMHVLGCLDRPTSGAHRAFGEDVAELSADALALRRRRIGFVFQAFHLVPGLSAVDNVALPLRYAKVPLAERRARARRVLERVGLGDRLEHLHTQLSGGQQQRVAVARALVVEPRMLLCDEPTGNLDSRAGAEIVDLLEGLWREGRTLIVVTHDEDLASRARRRLRMKDGRIETDSAQL